MKNYNIYNILKIKTNIDFFSSFLEVNKLKSPDLEIIKEDFNFDKNKSKEYYRFPIKYYSGDKKLYIEFKPKKTLLKILIENLEGKTKIYIKESGMFKPFHNVIFPGWPSIANLIIFLLQIKFLQKKHVLIHSATLIKNGNGIILPSWPSTGKSTTCYNLMKNNFDILGDEICIFSEKGIVYKTSESGFYTPKQRKIHFKYKTKKNHEKLKKLIIIKKGSVKIEKRNPKDIINMIIASTNYEFQNYFTRSIFLHYCFINNFDTDFIDKNTKKILLKALKNVECFVVYGNKNNFYKTIRGLV